MRNAIVNAALLGLGVLAAGLVAVPPATAADVGAAMQAGFFSDGCRSAPVAAYPRHGWRGGPGAYEVTVYLPGLNPECDETPETRGVGRRATAVSLTVSDAN